MRVNLLDLGEDAIPGAEAHDDLGHAEEEGLDPELHELAVEHVVIVRPADLVRGLELDPVDGRALLLWFRVPDF